MPRCLLLLLLALVAGCGQKGPLFLPPAPAAPAAQSPSGPVEAAADTMPGEAATAPADSGASPDTPDREQAAPAAAQP